MSKPDCVIGNYCKEHNFVHGAEAEEFRAKLEDFLKKLNGERNEDINVEDIGTDLQQLLDGTDARDSLAFVEVKPRRWKPENERAVRRRIKRK